GIRDFHVTGVQTCALPIFSQPDLLWRTDLIPSRIFTWQGPTWEQSVIFEWRRQSDRWDADVAKQGLVAWYVRRHSDGENLRLVQIGRASCRERCSCAWWAD